MDISERYPVFEYTEEYTHNGEVQILHKTMTVVSEHTNVYTGETILEVWIDYKEPIPVYIPSEEELAEMGMTPESFDGADTEPAYNVHDYISRPKWEVLYETRVESNA